jgi:hypothetical protein
MDPLSLEEFWEELLSRQPSRITAAYAKISGAEKDSIIKHLNKMTTEPGWHPEQRKSAQAALNVLKPNDKNLEN